MLPQAPEQIRDSRSVESALIPSALLNLGAHSTRRNIIDSESTPMMTDTGTSHELQGTAVSTMLIASNIYKAALPRLYSLNFQIEIASGGEGEPHDRSSRASDFDNVN